jgi:hypothetical protein
MPGKLGHRRGRQRSDGRDQEARLGSETLGRLDPPQVGRVVEDGGLHARIERDVAAQVELVGDELEVAQGFGLRREMLGPVPFLQDLVGERIPVRPALGIETRAGIAVPVPGAAHPAAGFEHAHRHAERAQAMQLVHAGHAGADDDRVVARHRSVGGLRRIGRGGKRRAHVFSS